jgi:mono/diheme cytochrome c family protein
MSPRTLPLPRGQPAGCSRRFTPRFGALFPATWKVPCTSDENLIAGGKLYLNDCVGCHGAPGKPPSDFGATFYPPAPQRARDGTTYSEAQIYWVAKHGIRRTGMSAQGPYYSDQKLWMLAGFINRITTLPPEVRARIEEKPGH